MHNFFSIINKMLTILVIITMTGQSIAQAQPSPQDGKITVIAQARSYSLAQMPMLHLLCVLPKPLA